MQDFIYKLSDKDIINLCHQVYFYKRDGRIEYNWDIYSYTVAFGVELDTFVKYLLNEAHNRFKDIVLVLMRDEPEIYLNL